MTNNSLVVNSFSNIINKNTKELSLYEMIEALTISYNVHQQKENIQEPLSEDDDDDEPKKRGRPANKPKTDKDGNLKVKRQPTAYNKFVKIQIEKLKKENPNISPKQLLPMAAEKWSNMSKQEKEDFKNNH